LFSFFGNFIAHLCSKTNRLITLVCFDSIKGSMIALVFNKINKMKWDGHHAVAGVGRAVAVDFHFEHFQKICNCPAKNGYTFT